MRSKTPSQNPSSQKLPPSSSSFRRKRSRWQSQSPNPNPKSSNPVEIPRISYDFDDLEQRSMVLFDGTVKSYYALPPNYPVNPTIPDQPHDEDYWSYLGLDDKPGPAMERNRGEKDDLAWLRESVRKYGNPDSNPSPNPNVEVRLDGTERKEKRIDVGFDLHRESMMRYVNPNESSVKEMEGRYASHRDSVRRYGNPNANEGVENQEKGLIGESARRYGSLDAGEPGRMEIEDSALNEAFLRCTKLINESLAERTMYLEDGRSKPLRCIVCGRTSRVFSDVHDLIVHAYTSKLAEFRIDHLGLHKALCVLMGWNYEKAPDASKAYKSLSADKAAANREELIVWPPTVIIHNTSTGRKPDGRMGGLSDGEVEMKLIELGFTGGTSKSLYGKGGHLGIAAVKFPSTQAGFKEAARLAEFLKKGDRGRERWAQMEISQTNDDEKNPALVEVDSKTGEKKNIFYGYLATASDLEKVDVDTRKSAFIKNIREFDP